MMKEYYLDKTNTHNRWNRSEPPRLYINSGDVVIFETQEGAGGQVTPETTSDMLTLVDRSKLHALTGPVFIKDAEPGDVLEIETIRLEHKNWGFTYITRGSLLAEDFPDPYIHHWKITDEGCYFKEGCGIIVPYEPFCGIMGVAPREDEPLITYPPRENGGNMDLPGLGVCSRLWLPVFAPGALFSVGDCHANQGEGEICGTAIECPMTVTLRFNLHKGLRLEEPRFVTAGRGKGYSTEPSYVTTGFGADLYKNAQKAVRYMIDYLSKNHNLTKEEAYILCSAAVDLKISNIVTPPNLLVSAYLPLSIFHNE